MPQECKILFTGDASGVTAAVKQLTDALNESNKRVEKSNASHEEHAKTFVHTTGEGKRFKHILNDLTADSPALGIAIQAAINPVAGILAGASLGFGLLSKSIEEEIKLLDEMGDRAARPGASIAESMREASISITASQTAYSQFVKHLNDDGAVVTRALTAQIALIKAQSDALKALQTAQAEAAKAAVDSKAATGEITPDAAAIARAKIEAAQKAAEEANRAKTAQQEIAATEAAAKKIAAEKAATEVQSRAAQDAVNDTKRQSKAAWLPKDQKQLEEQLPDQEAYYKKVKENADKREKQYGAELGKKPMMGRMSDEQLAQLKAEADYAKEQELRAKSYLDNLKKLIESDKEKEAALKAQQKAADEEAARLKKRLEELTNQFRTLTETLDRLKAEEGVKAQSAKDTAAPNAQAEASRFLKELFEKGGTGRLLEQAASAGAKPEANRTPEDNAALDVATRMLNDHGLNAQTWLSVLSKTVSNQENEAAQLKIILSRLEKVEAQAGGSWNQGH